MSEENKNDVLGGVNPEGVTDTPSTPVEPSAPVNPEVKAPEEAPAVEMPAPANSESATVAETPAPASSESTPASTTPSSGNVSIDAFGNYVTTPAGDDMKKGFKLEKKHFIFGGIVLALIVVIIVLLNVSGGSPEAVANGYAKAFQDLDSKAILNLLPQEALTKEDKDEFTETVDEQFDTFKDMEIKITKYEVKENEHFSKDKIEDYKDDFDDIGLEGSRVTDIYTYDVTFTAKMGDEEDSTTQTIMVIKYKGHWCLLPYEF